MKGWRDKPAEPEVPGEDLTPRSEVPTSPPAIRATPGSGPLRWPDSPFAAPSEASVPARVDPPASSPIAAPGPVPDEPPPVAPPLAPPEQPQALAFWRPDPPVVAAPDAPVVAAPEAPVVAAPAPAALPPEAPVVASTQVTPDPPRLPEPVGPGAVAESTSTLARTPPSSAPTTRRRRALLLTGAAVAVAVLAGATAMALGGSGTSNKDALVGPALPSTPSASALPPPSATATPSASPAPSRTTAPVAAPPAARPATTSTPSTVTPRQTTAAPLPPPAPRPTATQPRRTPTPTRPPGTVSTTGKQLSLPSTTLGLIRDRQRSATALAQFSQLGASALKVFTRPQVSVYGVGVSTIAVYAGGSTIKDPAAEIAAYRSLYNATFPVDLDAGTSVLTGVGTGAARCWSTTFAGAPLFVCAIASEGVIVVVVDPAAPNDIPTAAVRARQVRLDSLR